MTNGVVVDPDALRAAASQLDAAATLLESVTTTQSSLLAPPPAGGDEVSQLAARYFSVAAESHARDTAAVIAELRTTGAVLRREAEDYAGTDGAAAAAFGGVAEEFGGVAGAFGGAAGGATR